MNEDQGPVGPVDRAEPSPLPAELFDCNRDVAVPQTLLVDEVTAWMTIGDIPPSEVQLTLLPGNACYADRVYLAPIPQDQPYPIAKCVYFGVPSDIAVQYSNGLGSSETIIPDFANGRDVVAAEAIFTRLTPPATI
ncbi:MAG: hypothetical protein R2855_05930 [Thermomicrobiales bacterium]